MLACGAFSEGADIYEPTDTESTGTGTTSGPLNPSTSSTGETTSHASTTDPQSGSTGPEPLCGNGDLDEDEICDDGNMVDGDGCNADCTPSGEILLETIFDPNPDGDESILDIDHASDGSYVVSGFVFGETADLWAARFADDDSVLWATELVETDGIDYGWAVAANNGGSSYIAGITDTNNISTGDPYLARVSDTGEVVAVANDPTGMLGRWLSVDRVEDGAVVVGDEVFGGTQRGLIRHYSNMIVQAGELEPVAAAIGLTFRRGCATDAQLLVVGHQVGAGGGWESIELLADGAETAWTVVTPVAATDNTFASGCAAAGAGPDRELWTGGFTTTTQYRWVPWLRRRTVDGALDVEADEYTGELNLGAWYNDVDLDPAGNVVVVGADVIGPGDPDWRPLVRKLAPDGTLLWSRVFDAGDLPRGALESVSVGPAGEIRVVGYATDGSFLRRRYLARLTP